MDSSPERTPPGIRPNPSESDPPPNPSESRIGNPEKTELLETQRVAHFCWFLFEIPRRTLHNRESSGVAWGGWLMDLRQGWLVRFATHLRWSSAALRSSELPVWSRLRTGPSGVFRTSGGLTTVCEMVQKRDQTGSFEEQRAATDQRR